MKLIQITSLLLTVAVGSAKAAGGQLHASLEAQTNRPDRFLLHVTNVSSNTVRLLDVAEGSGFCGDLYEVTVEKEGKRTSSQGECFYAPGIDPTVVEIKPGQTYNREIQPVSYVYGAEHATAEQLTVTYRVSQRVRESYIWIRKLGADLSLTFTTDRTSGVLSDSRVHDTLSRPGKLGAAPAPAAPSTNASAAVPSEDQHVSDVPPFTDIEEIDVQSGGWPLWLMRIWKDGSGYLIGGQLGSEAATVVKGTFDFQKLYESFAGTLHNERPKEQCFGVSFGTKTRPGHAPTFWTQDAETVRAVFSRAKQKAIAEDPGTFEKIWKERPPFPE